MKLSHRYKLTISRVNEREHEAPELVVMAVSFHVDANGRLAIDEGEGRSRSLTSWDEFEAKRITETVR